MSNVTRVWVDTDALQAAVDGYHDLLAAQEEADYYEAEMAAQAAYEAEEYEAEEYEDEAQVIEDGA
jgi:hypothetical protein